MDCTPALGSTVGLDIDNDPAGPTPLTCEALQGTEVIRTLNMFVSVLDRTPPVIDPGSVPDPAVPGEVIIGQVSAAGAQVLFATPTATDALGVDPDVEVSCAPASGTLFPFTSPGPTTTTVTCTATDDSLNTDEVTFDVTIEDGTAPVIDGLDPPELEPPLNRFVLGENASSFQIFWGPFTVSDADSMPEVNCSVGRLDTAQSDPANGIYTFVHEFPAGTTDVVCTATDENGNTASGEFSITVLDETGPVITLNGDATLTVLQGSGPYVDPGATANDVVDGDVSDSIVIDASAVDTDVPGTYEVLITASDDWAPIPNQTTVTRTVIVKAQYAGATGIIPQKLEIRRGSSNPLFWAWLDEFGSPIDTSTDTQRLRIANCENGEMVVDIVADDSGSSDFRFKVDNFWQFNWDADVGLGEYCAFATSSRTGQEQRSPPISVQ